MTAINHLQRSCYLHNLLGTAVYSIDSLAIVLVYATFECLRN
jgi:hypothetical protein